MSYNDLMKKLANEWMEEARISQVAGMHILAENCRKIALEYLAQVS